MFLFFCVRFLRWEQVHHSRWLREGGHGLRRPSRGLAQVARGHQRHLRGHPRRRNLHAPPLNEPPRSESLLSSHGRLRGILARARVSAPSLSLSYLLLSMRDVRRPRRMRKRRPNDGKMLTSPPPSLLGFVCVFVLCVCVFQILWESVFVRPVGEGRLLRQCARV